MQRPVLTDQAKNSVLTFLDGQAHGIEALPVHGEVGHRHVVTLTGTGQLSVPALQHRAVVKEAHGRIAHPSRDDDREQRRANLESA